MNKIFRPLLICAFIVLIAGCDSGKYVIQDTQMSISDGEVKKTSVLLDTQTGDSWLLWTDKTMRGPGTYSWKKLPIEK